MDAAALRDAFPVLRRFAYLNAGTDGPLPARAVAAAKEELDREANDGRWTLHFERRGELGAALRAAYAGVLGCPAEDVALTTCTSEGLSIVLAGLDLEAGDEVLTSDEEHPGLLGALQAARDLRGVVVRMTPLAQIADAVGPRTRLIACSHVGWMSGSVAPEALAGLDVPVVLDGAQGAGAVPVDLERLGCDAYAAAGQKWLCGPDGAGMLYVAPRLRERLVAPVRGYASFVQAGDLDAPLHPDARRYDTLALGAETLACANAALTVLDEAGWPAVYGRARELATRLAELLSERGRTVAPRGATTLVSFASPEPERERAQLADAGVIVREIPGRSWLRASVGAWNDEADLQRLLAVLA